MAINRINETDLQGKLVSQLSNRPTDPRSAGGDNLTAQQVKARHDALGLLVKDKLNEFIDALNNATVGGEPVTPLSDLITVVADGVSKSLTEWIEAKLTKDATAGEGVHAYGVDNAGAQTILPVSDTATEGAIPQYGTGGVLPVADGTAEGHAVAKGQMTTAITNAVNALSATLTALINAKYTKPGTGIPLADLAQSVRDEIEGAVKASAAENYSALVDLLSEAPKTKYKAGQRFLIGTFGVPDVGVLSVEDSSVSYTYTTDGAFEASLIAGTLQIGYYVLRPVEGKTNLEDYSTTAETNTAISEAIDLLVDALVDGVISVAEAAYAESATYAQQADLANQINTDREIEDADTACPPAVFGTVGGEAEVQSGLMRFEELRGNTIKWNQLINKADFPSTRTINGITFTNNGDGTVTVSGTATATAYISVMSAVGKKIVGHKYLLRGCPDGGSGLSGYTIWDNVESKFDNGNGVIYTAANASDGGIYIRIESGTVISTPITFKPNYFDLTDIFGAGNEPSTVAEFVRSYRKPNYEYNAGTFLSSKSASLISVEKNQCPGLDEYFPVIPGETYEISGITAGGYLQEFDGNKTLIKTSSEITSATNITLNSRTVYCKLQATTYTIPFCYILWSTPGETAVPYSEQIISLPNIVLRRVGEVYDVAYQTGGGKRRIGERAYQSGDENDPDVLTDGTTTLYVLATETDIPLSENPGWDEYIAVDNFGTLRFTQDPTQDIPVPQAYFIRYTVNLVEFLDSLYVHCGGDVSKLALVE